MAKISFLQLENARRTKQLVRFTRRFEDFSIRGYILNVGPSFFLMALVSDRIRFDGFECFRASDVTDLVADPYAAFAESALQKRRERLPKRPRVKLANIEELLLSANRAFPLVAIHREQVDSSICFIGRVLRFARGCVSLLEINPDASWDEKPKSYRLDEITRVNFGGDYESALHLVGGDPVQTNKTPSSRRERVR